MGQHDYNIEDDPGAAVRADLNNALTAIATNNSGTVFPTTTFANMWAYREDLNELYLRNEANNAWIKFAKLDQTNGLWTPVVDLVEGTERATDPAAVANAALLYPKDVGGVTEWFSRDSAGNVTQLTSAGVLANKEAAIEFVIDGAGAVIATGEKGHLEVPFACSIKAVRLLADQSGSIVVDIWKDTYGNFAPVDADSITAAAPPTITATVKSEDAMLTGWTTALGKGDILTFNVDSATTVERVTLSLTVERT
ncbi:MAG: hypothetical protein RX318_03890 [bacterium]|nr:hypothetical protein [bacterium]